MPDSRAIATLPTTPTKGLPSTLNHPQTLGGRLLYIDYPQYPFARLQHFQNLSPIQNLTPYAVDTSPRDNLFIIVNTFGEFADHLYVRRQHPNISDELLFEDSSYVFTRLDPSENGVYNDYIESK